MTNDLRENAFLARLSQPTLDVLAKSAQRIDMAHGAGVYEPEGAVSAAYFPVSCVLSQVSRMRDGSGVETAMVGKDGAAGIIECLGSGRAVWESQVQVDGAAWAAPRQAIVDLAREDASFSSECWRLAEAQVVEARMSTACQALHKGEARLARWILEAHDRSGGRDPLPLTQEILATMLGVQRTTVTAFQGALQRRGLLAARRGKIWIKDKAGLEAVSCECRSTVRERRLFLGLEPKPYPAA
ncbi:MAG TPA: Crp/Fnr family transcriptional regulator [Phenylobacterium sp.]|nr:Crp/Fnr family transcriptional regulator [Phenylobacterium sp.]